MIQKLFEDINRHYTLKKKMIMLFLPLMVLTIVLFGQVSNIIYKHYIFQLAQKDLSQRTQRLGIDIDARLSVYKNISDYMFVNQEIKSILTKYNESEIVRYDEYLDDFLKMESQLVRYDIENCRVSLYIFNESLMSDGHYIKYINQYPEKSYINEIINHQGRISWFVSGVNKNEDAKPIIIIARTIMTDTGDCLAILNVEISYDVLYKIFNSVDVGKEGNYVYSFADRRQILSYGEQRASKKESNLSFMEKVEVNSSLLEISYSEELISKMGSTQRSALFVVTLLFILLSTLSAFVFSSLAVKRIQLFITKIKNLSEEAESMIIIDGRDEVGAIDKNFNEMFYNLREKVRIEHQLIIEKKEIEAELLKSQLEKKAMESELLKSQLQQKIVELELLQAQFNPHFLYNTLSAVRWSVIENGDEQAGEILDSLVTFYRSTLGAGKPIIPVLKEVEMVKKYVEIQQYTYDRNYRVYFDIAPEVEQFFCLKFLLQPLVENAIYHGVIDMEEAGEIRISANKAGDCVRFMVEDNGKGMEDGKVKELNRLNYFNENNGKSGYGIYNVIKRIKLYYGNRYGMCYSSVLGTGTRVEVLIPVCLQE